MSCNNHTASTTHNCTKNRGYNNKTHAQVGINKSAFNYNDSKKASEELSTATSQLSEDFEININGIKIKVLGDLLNGQKTLVVEHTKFAQAKAMIPPKEDE